MAAPRCVQGRRRRGFGRRATPARTATEPRVSFPAGGRLRPCASARARPFCRWSSGSWSVQPWRGVGRAAGLRSAVPMREPQARSRGVLRLVQPAGALAGVPVLEGALPVCRARAAGAGRHSAAARHAAPRRTTRTARVLVPALRLAPPHPRAAATTGRARGRTRDPDRRGCGRTQCLATTRCEIELSLSRSTPSRKIADDKKEE